jgi:hypothetical protein
MIPFNYLSRASNPWFHAGPSSSFPDIDPSLDSADLSQPRACSHKGTSVQGCKAFSISRADGAKGKPVTVYAGALEWDEDGTAQDLSDQVLVFRYRGKFHAVDHVRGYSTVGLHRATRERLLTRTSLNRNVHTRRTPCPRAPHSTLRILVSY